MPHEEIVKVSGIMVPVSISTNFLHPFGKVIGNVCPNNIVIGPFVFERNRIIDSPGFYTDEELQETIYRELGEVIDELFDFLASLPAWIVRQFTGCLLYTSPSPRDGLLSRMPSSA